MKKKAFPSCVYNIQFHLVFVTKYRKKCLTSEVREHLQEVFLHLAQRWEIELLEFSGEEDHVHLLISVHPVTLMSRLINNFKTVSSRLTRKKFSKHLNEFYWKPLLWNRSYCLLSTGGATIEVIKKYIQSQGK